MAAPRVPVNVVVEGSTDEAVIRRLLDHVGLTCGPVHRKSKPTLLQRLPNYNQAARHAPWLVVVDLDRSAPCAPAFVEQHLPEPAAGMRFRVAVRAVEAWLLADSERIAGYLGISRSKVPRDPDAEENPKRTLVNLAGRSRRRTLREDIVPRAGSGSPVGPGYPTRVLEFVVSADRGWRPEVAMRNSDSLRRCIDTLRHWKQELD